MQSNVTSFEKRVLDLIRTRISPIRGVSTCGSRASNKTVVNAEALCELHNTRLSDETEPERLGEQRPEMETLFLSFWNICLDKLPEGVVTHRRIEPEDARQTIEEARAKEALECCTAEDLLAPYHKRKRDNHEALCLVLNDHFGIRLGIDDFLTAPDEEGFYSANPLFLANVEGSNKLLVITCTYVLPDKEKRSKGFRELDIEPSSVEFHLFESADGH